MTKSLFTSVLIAGIVVTLTQSFWAGACALITGIIIDIYVFTGE